MRVVLLVKVAETPNKQHHDGGRDMRRVKKALDFFCAELGSLAPTYKSGNRRRRVHNTPVAVSLRESTSGSGWRSSFGVI